MPTFKRIPILLLFLALYAGAIAQVSGISKAKRPSGLAASVGWMQSAVNFPGSIKAFEENKGQYLNTLNDWKVAYACKNRGATILFTDKGLIYALTDTKKKVEGDADEEEAVREAKEFNKAPVTQLISIEWPGANSKAQIEAVEETPFYFSSCDLKDPSIPLNHIKSYRRLIYHDLYPGIDLEFSFHPETGIKYALRVKAGADARTFSMRYSGQQELKIDRSGHLHIKTPFGDMLDHAPLTKLISGEKITSGFVLKSRNEVGFDIADKDVRAGLVIDPWTVTPLATVPAAFVPTFVGMDAGNNVYILGFDGASKLMYSQKYSAAGVLAWTYTYNEYPGGSWVAGLAVDPAGNVYAGQAKGSALNASNVYYKMVCVNTGGTRTYYYNTYAVKDIYETLTLAYSCSAQTLVEAGSRYKGAAGNVTYAAVMNPANGNVGAVSSDTLTGEVYGCTVAPNGNFYCLAVDSNANGGTGAATSGPYNNLRCYAITGATVTPSWKLHVDYALLDYTAKSGPNSLSLNGVAAGCGYLYTTDGVRLDQRSLTTGALIKRVTIPGGSNAVKGNMNGGLAVDIKCGYVYVGSANNMYCYDATLNPIFTYSGLPGIVYGVYFNNGMVACTGATSGDVAFVAQFPAQTCATPIVHVNPTCGKSNGSATANPTFCSGPYTYLWTPSGQTTATATGLAAGLYTVQIGSSSYCVTVADTVTLKPTTGGTATITGTNVSCAGGTNGTATVTMTGGATPYTYSWSPAPATGQTGATATGLPAGTYACSVTDNGGCIVTQTIVITEPPALTATNAPTNVTCFGGTNGAVTVTAAGGTPAYTYSWTPAPASGTAATAGSLTAGTYTCTITDSKGCKITSIATITQPPALTASSTNTPATCGSANGSATAAATGGTGAYSYSWNPSGQLTATASAIGSGTYTCTITDANGCVITTTTTVGTTGGPTLVLGTITNITCFGLCNGSIPVTASGGLTPYTYSWSPAPGGGQATATATALCVGTYTCSVTDAQGCLSTVNGTVTQPPALTVSTTNTSVSCFGLSDGTASGTASGGTAPYTYSWTPTPGVGQGTSNASGFPAGSYTLTVTDAHGCVIIATGTISKPPLITVKANGTNATCHNLCNGGLICVPAGGTATYSYSWSSGCVQASCTNVCPGLYTITLTDAHGCKANDTITISQPPGMILTLAPKATHCGKADGGDTVHVSGGSPGYTFSWSPQGGTTNIATGIVSGTYTVVVKDSHGCLDTAKNTVANLPGVNITLDSIRNVNCFGGTDGMAAVHASGGFPAYTYSWNPGNQTTPKAIGLGAGTYTCTVTDSAGCKNSVTATLTQPPLLTVTTKPATICLSSCTDLSAQVIGGSPAYTYTWIQGGTITPSHVCPAVTTTYTVGVVDSHGCIAAATAIITVNLPLEVSASGGKPICPGSSAQLNANGNGGNGGPYTYTWIPTSGLSSSTIYNPVATPTVTTTYTVIIADNCGTPTDSSMTTVTVLPLPVVSFTSKDSVKCAPVCAVFTGSSVPGCVSGSWDFGDGNTGKGCNTAQHCYMTAGTYTITYNVTDSSGCKGSATVPNFINVLPLPIAAFTYSPDPATILAPTITFTDQSAGPPVTWNWHFGNPGDSASINQNPVFTYADTGCYNVTLLVSAANGCTDQVTHPVCIEPYFTFYAPNTFTPNGDGKNDIWMPYGIGIDPRYYDLIMFDRWGNLMFETHIWGEGWDGRANHGTDIAQIDTYVWKVVLKDVLHQSHTYIGHCNIIK
jgi:gliding motility-associated-like protein